MNKIDSVGYEMLSEISKNTNYFIQVITIAIAAPIVEELLFRGLVYKRLKGIEEVSNI